MDMYRWVLTILEENPFVDLSDHSTYTELNFKKLLQFCLVERKWTSYAYNRFLKCARKYCEYLKDAGLIHENPLGRAKLRPLPKTLPKSFDRDQVSLLLYALNRIYPASGDFVSERNRAVIYAYLYTGLRLYELINLKIEHLDPAWEHLRVVDGKGGKDRLVPVVSKLYPVLARYMPIRDAAFPDSRYVFPTKYGNPMQHREVYDVLKKLQAKLGFRITAHMFRHTFATELARKQINLFNISRIL